MKKGTTGDAEVSRYERLFELVNGARDQDPEARDAWLADACADEPELAGEVLALLAAGSDEEREDAFADSGVAATRRALEGAVERALSDTAAHGDATGGATGGATGDARGGGGAAGTGVGGAGWLPETIGGYRILRILGQGGMGVVYEAEQASPRRRVAVKLLHPLQATGSRLQRFKQEAALLGRLRHPGIAQIFEAGTYDIGLGPQPFFAMELVDGLDLRSHCEMLHLDRRARLELLARVADAVQYAHDQGVVHRDIKPDNVLVDEHGAPRILDFGVARTTTPSTALSSLVTEDGQLVGTLAYMAPEQLTRGAEAVGPRADVYALGMLAFEVLVGRLPWELDDLTLSRAVALLSRRDAPRLGGFDPELRGDVETIVQKALESEPNRRYESAAALAADLRRHLADEPIRARPPSGVYLARKFARRHRGLVVGAVATVLTLVAGTIVALVLADDAREQRDLAQLNERRALHGVLQSAQTLVDAGRPRDALTQLWLVPESERGFAWDLVDRATPHVVEAPGHPWRFLDDDHLVAGVRPGDDTGRSACSLLVYSIPEQRVVGEVWPDARHIELRSVTPGGLALANSYEGDDRHDQLLFEVETGRTVARAPGFRRDGTAPVPGEERRDEVGTMRDAELSDDGRTQLWFTSPDVAEVRRDGQLVHTVRDLGALESVHLGPEGRLLAVNRLDEVTVLDLDTGALRFRAPAPAPGFGVTGWPVPDGVLVLGHHEGLYHSPPRTAVWRRFDLPEGGGLLEVADVSTDAPGGFRLPTASGGKHHTSRDGHVAAWSYHSSDYTGSFLGSPATGRRLDVPPLGTHEVEGAGYLLFEETRGAETVVSPSGRRVVVMSGWAHDQVVELDPRTADPAAHAQGVTLRGHAGVDGDPRHGWIYHLAVSHDGRLVASSAPLDPRVRVWDAHTGEQLAVLDRDLGDRWADNPGTWEGLMAFSPDDERLVLTTPHGGVGMQVLDWELATGVVTPVGEPVDLNARHLTKLDEFVESLGPLPRQRFSQRVHHLDGETLAVNHPPAPGVRGAPRPDEGEGWRYVPGFDDTTVGLSVHPTEPRAAVVQAISLGMARQGILSIVDTDTGEVLEERRLDHQPWCVDYSPDGELLAIGTDEGFVLLYETETLERQLVWRAHEHGLYPYVSSLAWTALALIS